MSHTDKADELMEIIKQFYTFANVTFPRNLVINESVAEVFGIMLKEAATCSELMNWIPTPPGGKATIAWLVINFGNGVLNYKKAQLRHICARESIRKWRSQLEMASLGVALKPGVLPIWA